MPGIEDNQQFAINMNLGSPTPDCCIVAALEYSFVNSETGVRSNTQRIALMPSGNSFYAVNLIDFGLNNRASSVDYKFILQNLNGTIVRIFFFTTKYQHITSISTHIRR